MRGGQTDDAAYSLLGKALVANSLSSGTREHFQYIGRASRNPGETLDLMRPVVSYRSLTENPMPIWKKPFDLSLLNASNHGTAARHLGIEIIEMGDDFVRGRVPAAPRPKQPFGLLHGGVSVVLAESLGSVGAYYASPEGHSAVGLDINANHLRSARSRGGTGRLGQGPGAAGAPRAQHPGLAYRPGQRSRRTDLRLAPDHGHPGAALAVSR